MNKTGTVFFLAKYLKIFYLFKSFKSNYLFMYLFYLIYLYISLNQVKEISWKVMQGMKITHVVSIRKS